MAQHARADPSSACRTSSGHLTPARPAQALTEHRTEFFAQVDPRTVDRFRKLFVRLNATLRPAKGRTPIADELKVLSDPRTQVSARGNRHRSR